MGRATRWIAGGLAALLIVMGVGVPAKAQDTVEIRADGPNVSDSAAGADNVRVELNPGRQQAAAGQGQGNQEIRRAPRQEREQDRDRNRNRGRNNNGGNGGGGGVADAAPAAAAAPSAQQAAEATAGSETRPVQLPATGVGATAWLPALIALAGAGAAGLAFAARRRA